MRQGRRILTGLSFLEEVDKPCGLALKNPHTAGLLTTQKSEKIKNY